MAKFYWRLYGGGGTTPPPNKQVSMDFPWLVHVKSWKKLCEGSIANPCTSQGHPTTVFCEIYVRRSKYCLEIFVTWERLKISRWPYHSCAIFEAYLINSLRFSDVYFSHFTSQVRLFFVEKRKPIIFGLKTAMEKEIRKFLTFVVLQIASKIFGKIILKPF